MIAAGQRALSDVVICEPVRTPVGRYGGCFKDLPATALIATVLEELVARTGIPPKRIDDVVLGQCYPNGEAPAIGRVAALDAGLPITVSGIQLDRRCGSGLMAVLYAAMQIVSGSSDCIVAGGVESMSQVEHYSPAMRWAGPGKVVLYDRLERARVTAGGHRHPVPGGMLETAENLRREYSISREEQDALALESHRRAVDAIEAGRFKEETVPVVVTDRSGVRRIVRDEHPRPDASMEALASLRPVMGRQDPDATVTAGNASGQNDGAAACLVARREVAEELGLQPIAHIVSWAVAGVEPGRMGIGPVPATERSLALAGLSLDDMGLIELNEAFAAQVLACTCEWGFNDSDFERLNVNGSGISLGHPVGATGTRILATLLREMQRRGVDHGLETMCIGGGQGLAAIFELES